MKDSRLTTADLHPEGGLVATGSVLPEGGKGKVQLWDTKTGGPFGKPFIAPSQVNHVAFSPNGRFLAMAAGRPGSTSGEVRIWDLQPNDALSATSPVLQSTKFTGAPSHVAFSPDSRYFLAASAEAGGSIGMARMWDLDALNSPPILEMPHRMAVNRAVFSADGRYVGTAAGSRGIGGG